MGYISKQPPSAQVPTVKLTTMLGEAPLCRACQMELFPYKDINGDFVFPKEFCDDKCKSVWNIYEKWFREGRRQADVNRMKMSQSTEADTPILVL